MCSCGSTIPTGAGPAPSSPHGPHLPARHITGPVCHRSTVLLRTPGCTAGMGQRMVPQKVTGFPGAARSCFSPARRQLGCDTAAHWCRSTCCPWSPCWWPHWPCPWPFSMAWPHVGCSSQLARAAHPGDIHGGPCGGSTCHLKDVGCPGKPLADGVSGGAGIRGSSRLGCAAGRAEVQRHLAGELEGHVLQPHPEGHTRHLSSACPATSSRWIMTASTRTACPPSWLGLIWRGLASTWRPSPGRSGRSSASPPASGTWHARTTVPMSTCPTPAASATSSPWIWPRDSGGGWHVCPIPMEYVGILVEVVAVQPRATDHFAKHTIPWCICNHVT